MENIFCKRNKFVLIFVKTEKSVAHWFNLDNPIIFLISMQSVQLLVISVVSVITYSQTDYKIKKRQKQKCQ